LNGYLHIQLARPISDRQYDPFYVNSTIDTRLDIVLDTLFRKQQLIGLNRTMTNCLLIDARRLIAIATSDPAVRVQYY